MIITIKGDTPSKKNSKRIFRNQYTGKPFIASSEVYERWYRGAMPQLKGVQPVGEISRVGIIFYPKTRRASDLTNKAESIMDLLVDAGIIEDDNWFICPDIRLKFGGVDHENPRAEVMFI